MRPDGLQPFEEAPVAVDVLGPLAPGQAERLGAKEDRGIARRDHRHRQPADAGHVELILGIPGGQEGGRAGDRHRLVVLEADLGAGKRHAVLLEGA